MNVPIISDGSFCVGETVTLTACCSSELVVTWETEIGQNNVSLVGNGHTAQLTIINADVFKVKAICCTAE